MPCNLYGYNDKYDLNNSHVLPALIRKVHEAKKNKLEEIILWGSGKPLREFLFVDDLINACIKIMIKDNNPTLINVGSGKDISILNLLKLIMKTLKYECKIKRDRSKPDGTLKKLMDISYVKKIGWKSKISLKKGINLAYRDYIKRYDK
jgi:GDP-L-fucose synthase